MAGVQPGNNPSAEMADELAQQAASEIAAATGVQHHDIAIILGSGWAPAIEAMGTVIAALPAADISGFIPSGIAGHSGALTSIRLDNGKHVLAIGARAHLYQGLGVNPVVHPIRTAAATGASVAVLTNAAGGLNPEWRAGTLVQIADQINMTGQTPLTGAEFLDLTDLYSAELRRVVLAASPGMPEGVYVGTSGPEYETPAESRMKRLLGGDLVGMSTVLEAIAARAAGMGVVGLSLIANQAAHAGGSAVTHAEVLATVDATMPRMRQVLQRSILTLSERADYQTVC